MMVLRQGKHRKTSSLLDDNDIRFPCLEEDFGPDANLTSCPFSIPRWIKESGNFLGAAHTVFSI